MAAQAPSPQTGPSPVALSPAARALAARCEPKINGLARRTARSPYEWPRGQTRLPAEVRELEIATAARYGLQLFQHRVRDPQSGPADHNDRSAFRERAAHRAVEGVPLHLLLRSHSQGLQVLWQALREAARPGDEAALIELSGFLLAAQERIVGPVAESYVDEHAALTAERREQRRSLARGLLDGFPPPPDAWLGLDNGVLVLHLDIPPAPRGTGTTQPSPAAVRRRTRRVQTVLDRSFGAEVPALLDDTGGHAVVPGGSEPPDGLTDRLRHATGAEIRLAAVAAARVEDIPAAARTAAEVVRVARACGRPPGLHLLDDVLLEYHLSRRDESSDRIAALLDPIGDRPELTVTLRTYLERQQDRRSTARQLGLHPNTVDNRLARIAELTRLDLASPRGTALALAALLLRGDTG